ncbi:unnamed protein product [Rotaria socialis]|uniref:Uncharacterized protein n=1 Tax=Rotaria socialis TaxID=392032 RepID=A0A821BZH2_9BILA|nr:unnamed protein product [Rotaria socialis]CAF3344729.1 unnamed protein product [Rotaria socialis]CAF3346241.1 unnamed protein product [Rotaria socialis]CAF3378704.1 unnamed protein product [Rotaria socialis]CAF3506022.1 unnamed protein product [Rotaria socialis]
MHDGRIVGLATPCLVHGCTIRNESSTSVYVRLLYQPIKNQQQVFERRTEFQLAKGGETHIKEEEFDKGSFQIRETIQTIEVTRADGRIQEINAPFDKVDSIELDWLFIIDHANIRSVKQNS